ncbi:integrase [Sphingobium limneticum]
MPAIENVTRRGAVYWWRRRVRFAGRSAQPIIVASTVSLLTKEQNVARYRASSMTVHSEVMRVSLYEKIEREGLTAEQVAQVFQQEMVRYRTALSYQTAAISADGEGRVPERQAEMLSIYAALNGDFATNGFSDYLGMDYVGAFDTRFGHLDDTARRNLYAMLGRSGNLPANLASEAADLLKLLGIAQSPERIEIARRLMCEARCVAAATFDDPTMRATGDLATLFSTLLPQAGVPAGAVAGVVPSVVSPSASSLGVESTPAVKVTLTDEESTFARMLPTEAVEEYMRLKPKARGRSEELATSVVRTGKKSKAKVWGESQRRQFQAAPFYFGKSNGGKPLAATRQEDLNNFYDHLNRLPSTHHKSNRHDAMKLEDICAEAAETVDRLANAGEVCTFTIGLDVGTINRHFANLKKLCLWMAAKTPMASLDFSDFILEEDDRDERDERDPYTIQQGQELFALPIWTGGHGVEITDRLKPKAAGQVWHDAAYWVMPIVWYSGMRREEACKLLVDDIDEEDGIPYFNIRKTSAGSVKNATSIRKVPICEELRRLGFLDYVSAMRAEGETYLFPEIMPGRVGRSLGDVFFKNIWLNIKPHLTLVKPGQAVHSGRHMVSTELKMLQTFEEFRSDLLGQKSGGINASRYAGATRLEVLLGIVDQIPKVTKLLAAPSRINLLPKAMRGARPVRESVGRRQR